MPKYMYQVIDKEGNPKQIIELEHGMNEKMTTHPETGEKLVRVYVPFGINGAQKKISEELGGLEYDVVESLEFAVSAGDPLIFKTDQGDIDLAGNNWALCKLRPRIPGFKDDFDSSLN